MASTSSRVIRLFDMLRTENVRFLVVGGRAEALMGSPRPTYDTDIAYDRTPDNLEATAKVLRQLDAKLRVNGKPLDVPYPLDAQSLALGSNYTFCTNLGEDFDLLGYVEPVGTYDDLLPNAESHLLEEGFSVPTIGLTDLIRVKQHIARQKDAESLQQLLAIQRVRLDEAKPDE